MGKYLFDTVLTEGLILKRPNRFLMDVLINNELVRCHCPSTGRIGGITFDKIPCLLSKCNNSKRKTDYTVEAISLNKPEDKKKYWIGINQVKANRYIEYFLKTNQLIKIVKCDKNTKILREKFIGNSKLDFLVNNSYIEVKTPLVQLQLKKHYFTNKNIKISDFKNFNSTDRFLKHIEELSNSLKIHEKAYLITLFMFDAKKFNPPRSERYEYIFNAVSQAKNSGVEIWQVNLSIDEYGVELKSYVLLK